MGKLPVKVQQAPTVCTKLLMRPQTKSEPDLDVMDVMIEMYSSNLVLVVIH